MHRIQVQTIETVGTSIETGPMTGSIGFCKVPGFQGRLPHHHPELTVCFWGREGDLWPWYLS